MKTFGGDASNLICTTERLHPNNNYDKTASRILHAFQSSYDYPKGPGIKDSKSGLSMRLMEKCGHSYADALQNCAMAALAFLTEDGTSAPELPSITEFRRSDAISWMNFGWLDACHTASTSSSKEAQCGNPGILPTVHVDAEEADKWFRDRGLAVGAWLGLVGTHTTLDNFRLTETLRNVGVGDQDYFEDYVWCPKFTLKAPVNDPEKGGCEWSPSCASGKAKGRSECEWPMVQSDCANGSNLVEDLAVESKAVHQVQEQLYKYIQDVGSWVPDCVCGLIHLGGRDNVDCVGPNSVDKSPSNSLFGSVFYPISAPLASCSESCRVPCDDDEQAWRLVEETKCIDGDVIRTCKCTIDVLNDFPETMCDPTGSHRTVLSQHQNQVFQDHRSSLPVRLAASFAQTASSSMLLKRILPST